MQRVNPNVAIAILAFLITVIILTVAVLLVIGLSFERIAPILTIITLLVTPAISAIIAFLFGVQANATSNGVSMLLQSHLDAIAAHQPPDAPPIEPPSTVKNP